MITMSDQVRGLSGREHIKRTLMVNPKTAGPVPVVFAFKGLWSLKQDLDQSNSARQYSVSLWKPLKLGIQAGEGLSIDPPFGTS